MNVSVANAMPLDSATSFNQPNSTNSLAFFDKYFDSNYNSREQNKAASYDDEFESDYCMVHNESCKGETSDGWLLVSDE